MRSTSFLLRLLLCLVLAVNGMGLAQAGLHAEAPQAAAVARDVAPPGGCHEDAEPQASPDAPMSGTHPAGDTGCCDGAGDGCRCLCMAQTPLVFVVATVPAAMRVPDRVVSAASTWHRPPRLPHLIRPPIG